MSRKPQDLAGVTRALPKSHPKRLSWPAIRFDYFHYVLSSNTLLLFFAALPLSAANLFEADFATYADGNLVGQNGWSQVGTNADNPIQVANGSAVLGGFTGTSQDARVAAVVPISAGQTFYYGLTLQALGPGNNGAGFFSSYFFGVEMGGFANGRLALLNIDGDTYQFSLRVNGQSSNPFNVADPVFTFGSTQQTVLMSWTFADPDGINTDTLRLWINPTSVSANPDLVLTNLGTVVSSGMDSLTFSQFGFSSAVEINRVAVGMEIESVFDYVSVIPEPRAFALLGGLVALAIAACQRRRRFHPEDRLGPSKSV